MGTLTHPKGQSVTVPDAAEAYYLDKGWTHAGSAPVVEESTTPDKSWKNDDLVTYAAEHNIELDGATKKDDLLAAIATGKQIVPAVPPEEPAVLGETPANGDTPLSEPSGSESTPPE
jgi:hypothetical protein